MTGPLEGLRVLDFTAAWAGPFATRALAYLGAEVIKVEAANHMDVWRSAVGGGAPEYYPDKRPGERPYNRSALFNTQNHDKRSIAIDMKSEKGRALVFELALDCHLVIANFSPGVLSRFGLSYETLKELNPAVVVVEMPAFRSESSMASHVGMGKTMEAASGMTSLMGYRPGEAPTLTGSAYLDPAGGLHGALASLLGLLRAKRSGTGAQIEVAQTDAATRWIGEYVLEQLDSGTSSMRYGNEADSYAPHDAFPCLGVDQWIAIAIGDKEAWTALVELMENEGLAEDGKFASFEGRMENAEELYGRIANWTSKYPKHILASRLQAAGVLAAPVNGGKDIHDDAELNNSGFITELVHEECGTHMYPGLAYRHARTPGRIRRAAPLFGEATEYVLSDLLGLKEEEIESLEASGVVARAPQGKEVQSVRNTRF